MDYITFFRNSEKTIQELHARIGETVKGRSSEKGRERWSQACAEFHASYDGLAFPGGYSNGLERLKKNDKEAIEAALVFLEIRPYFFRSGYMRGRLMRALKRASLGSEDARRFEAVVEAQRQWQLNKKTP